MGFFVNDHNLDVVLTNPPDKCSLECTCGNWTDWADLDPRSRSRGRRPKLRDQERQWCQYFSCFEYQIAHFSINLDKDFLCWPAPETNTSLIVHCSMSSENCHSMSVHLNLGKEVNIIDQERIINFSVKNSFNQMMTNLGEADKAKKNFQEVTWAHFRCRK